MSNHRKEFCLERLLAIIENLNTAEAEGARFYFLCKAEGFLEGLFYADIIGDKEYSEWGEHITDIYIKK